MYSAAAGFEGPDEFTYTARDPAGRESTATVFVTVEAPPAAGAPVAHDDEVSTRRGTKVDFGVLANDEGTPPLVLDDVTQPAHGTATCSPAGQCTYQPEAGFSGSDGFRYTISSERRSALDGGGTRHGGAVERGLRDLGVRRARPGEQRWQPELGRRRHGSACRCGRRRARRTRASGSHGHADRCSHHQAGLGHDCTRLERRPGDRRLRRRARRLERAARRGRHAVAGQAAAAHQPGHRRATVTCRSSSAPRSMPSSTTRIRRR